MDKDAPVASACTDEAYIKAIVGKKKLAARISYLKELSDLDSPLRPKSGDIVSVEND